MTTLRLTWQVFRETLSLLRTDPLGMLKAAFWQLTGDREAAQAAVREVMKERQE